MEPSQPPVSWAAIKLPLLPQLASADRQRVQLHVQPLWVEAQQVLAQAMCPAQPRTTRLAQPDLTDASPPCRYPAMQSAGTAPATSLAATATAAAARPPSAGCTCAGGFELQSRLLPGSWHRTPLRSTPAPRFCCSFPHQPTHPAVFLLHLSPINQSMNQSHVPATQHSPLLPYLSPVDLPPSSFLRRLFPSAQLCYLYSCPCPAQLSGMYADTLLCCWLFSALLTAALHFRCGLTSTAMLVKFVGVIIIISKMISHEMKSGWGALG